MSLLTDCPHNTAEEARCGSDLYNDLGMVMASYRDWFAEGRPPEWLVALEAIQAVLTRAKRHAKAACDRAGHAEESQTVLAL